MRRHHLTIAPRPRFVFLLSTSRLAAITQQGCEMHAAPLGSLAAAHARLRDFVHQSVGSIQRTDRKRDLVISEIRERLAGLTSQLTQPDVEPYGGVATTARAQAQAAQARAQAQAQAQAQAPTDQAPSFSEMQLRRILSMEEAERRLRAKLDVPAANAPSARGDRPAAATLQSQARPALLGPWGIPKVPPRLKCDILRVKPSAQTHTDAPHCSSHCHQFRVF